MRSGLREAKENPNIQNWRELTELTICRLTIFNKRRSNEPSNLLVKRYLTREQKAARNVHKDILSSLSPIEKQLMQR